MSFIAVAAVGAGIVVAGGAYSVAKGAQMQKQAKQIKPEFNKFQKSPYAQAALATAQNRLYGNSQFQSAFMDRQQKQSAGIQRQIGQLAPDQALQALNNLQNSNNDANIGFNAQQEQMGQQRANDYYGALQMNTAENDKAYETMWAKYNMDINRQQSLRNAGNQMVASGINTIGNGVMSFGMGGMGGGLGAAKGGGGLFGATNNIPASSWASMSGANQASGLFNGGYSINSWLPK